ncbi:hypothetical protein VUR80DRAFT_8272 [Thermomyces stellatus]
MVRRACGGLGRAANGVHIGVSFPRFTFTGSGLGGYRGGVRSFGELGISLIWYIAVVSQKIMHYSGHLCPYLTLCRNDLSNCYGVSGL